MRIREYTISGLTANAAGIAAAQTFTVNVPLTLVGGVGTLSPPREVELVASVSIAATIFTLIGVDRWGNVITETITGVTTSAVRSRKVYAGITSITPSTTDGTNTVSAGWTARVPSPWVISNTHRGADAPPSMKVATEIVLGAPDGVIEGTYENVMQISGEGAKVDDSVAVTPPDVNSITAAFARFVVITNTGTTLKARFLRPSF